MRRSFRIMNSWKNFRKLAGIIREIRNQTSNRFYHRWKWVKPDNKPWASSSMRKAWWSLHYWLLRTSRWLLLIWEWAVCSKCSTREAMNTFGSMTTNSWLWAKSNKKSITATLIKKQYPVDPPLWVGMPTSHLLRFLAHIRMVAALPRPILTWTLRIRISQGPSVRSRTRDALTMRAPNRIQVKDVNVAKGRSLIFRSLDSGL